MLNRGHYHLGTKHVCPHCLPAHQCLHPVHLLFHQHESANHFGGGDDYTREQDLVQRAEDARKPWDGGVGSAVSVRTYLGCGAGRQEIGRGYRSVQDEVVVVSGGNGGSRRQVEKCGGWRGM